MPCRGAGLWVPGALSRGPGTAGWLQVFLRAVSLPAGRQSGATAPWDRVSLEGFHWTGILDSSNYSHGAGPSEASWGCSEQRPPAPKQPVSTAVYEEGFSSWLSSCGGSRQGSPGSQPALSSRALDAVTSARTSCPGQSVHPVVWAGFRPLVSTAPGSLKCGSLWMSWRSQGPSGGAAGTPGSIAGQEGLDTPRLTQEFRADLGLTHSPAQHQRSRRPVFNDHDATETFI